MKKIRILALIAAFATALGIYLFFQSVNRPVKTSKTNVVVAAVSIAADTTVTKDMVKETSVDSDSVLPNAVQDPSQVIGMVMNADTVPGEQILSSRILKAGKTGNQTLDYSVKPGMRAITVAVDNTKGLSGLIKPGNRIDLIAQFQVDEKAETGSGTTGKFIPMTKILLQNIKVLAIDQVLTKETKSSGGNYSTITLEVTPKQAVEVSYCARNSALQAILRSPVDDKEVQVPHITQKDVVDNSN